jgi:hypothetical protein
MDDQNDYELAEAALKALLQLHSKMTLGTFEEIDLVAAKAALPPNYANIPGRAKVDDARSAAWLAICMLAEHVANSKAPMSAAPELSKAVWAAAIDETNRWLAAAKESSGANDNQSTASGRR